MRPLLLTTHLEFGGIPVYTVQLATALRQRGHEPVVASGGGVLVESLTAAGIPHAKLHPAIAVAVAQVVGIIRRVRPDLLHAQTRVAYAVAALAGRLTGVPVVTAAHGFYGVAQDPMDPPRFQQQTAWFRQMWGVANGGPVIGSIARLTETKLEHVLLEAFHRVRQHIPSAQLLLVGDGPQKSALIRQAYAFGDEDHVVIAGPVTHTVVPLSMMDVFVLSSSEEALGLALVEAMARRRPVVASAVGGMREIVRHGETGFLVPPGDPQALAGALRWLLEHPAEARAMGEAGYHRYREHFTIERVAEEVEQVYADVVRERR